MVTTRDCENINALATWQLVVFVVALLLQGVRWQVEAHSASLPAWLFVQSRGARPSSL